MLLLPSTQAQGEMLTRRVADLGLEPIVMPNAHSALRYLAHERAGLCLTHHGYADELLNDLKILARQTPTVVLDHEDSSQRAVIVIRAGAVDYLPGPGADDTDALLTVIRSHMRSDADADVIQAAPESRRVFELAERVARTDVSVLISGESGTGKEVIAGFIHRRSDRREAPFIAINCAAIPENMLEAILFGHMKGAYTGAHQSQPGKFEQAHGGSLLLDEISEMPLGLQSKLLRALQEREVERLGARNTIPVDVRVLATTNVDIKAAVANGKFREDLYYRLSVFPLRMAPLRDRREDILELARFFLVKHGAPRGLHFDVDAEAALLTHSWPGNVRELENSVLRALVLHSGDVIRADDLVLDRSGTQTPVEAHRLEDKLQDTEWAVIKSTLRGNHGRRQRTAEELGISERTLRYKLKRMRDAGMEVD